jgi:hypothetical protein
MIGDPVLDQVVKAQLVAKRQREAARRARREISRRVSIVRESVLEGRHSRRRSSAAVLAAPAMASTAEGCEDAES